MVRHALAKMVEALHKKSKIPWANFEISGFEDDGRIKVNFLWNKAFIEKIYALGFRAETEDESVMLFYYASQMRPAFNGEDEEVHSEFHPSL